jgi:hypothetical protein
MHNASEQTKARDTQFLESERSLKAQMKAESESSA